MPYGALKREMWDFTTRIENVAETPMPYGALKLPNQFC